MGKTNQKKKGGYRWSRSKSSGMRRNDPRSYLTRRGGRGTSFVSKKELGEEAIKKRGTK